MGSGTIRKRAVGLLWGNIFNGNTQLAARVRAFQFNCHRLLWRLHLHAVSVAFGVNKLLCDEKISAFAVCNGHTEGQGLYAFTPTATAEPQSILWMFSRCLYSDVHTLQ